MSGEDINHESRIIMAAGIAAGALHYALLDLERKAHSLPPGELRKTWTDAAATMRTALEDAMDVHRKATGRHT